MISITIENFLKEYKKINPNENINKLEYKIKKAVTNKQSGTKCMVCGNPIWAVGSAVSGSNLCFNCTTGEANDCEDYEIDTVNY